MVRTKRLRSPRYAAALCAAAALVLGLSASPPASAERVRRNIDDLDTQQLGDYLHAVAKLKEISRQDPASKDGYVNFAELHDEFDVGPCEHSSDTFLPWHRAHLLEFEDALRRSDPPRTVDVTVPYWDWSRLPTGRRYAKAFEDTQSVLYASGRHDKPICKLDGDPQCEGLPWPRSYLEAKVLTASGWRGVGAAFFGGVSDDNLLCRPRRRTGYGALEQPAHNDMHSVYIGGLMRSPTTAAEDPIFWSFHAYIDLLLAQWQENAGHAIDTCLDCELCGLTKRSDGSPWRVRDTLSTADLGYRYEYVPAVVPPPLLMMAEGALFPPLPAAGMALSGRLPIEVLRTMEVPVPEAVEAPVMFTLTGVPRPSSFSYNGDVYLYPEGEEFTPRNERFRRRFLVDVFSIWESHHAHTVESAETEIVLDLTEEMQALSAGHAGETWNLTVALVANTLGRESRHAFAADAVGEESSFAEQMSFDRMDLEGLR